MQVRVGKASSMAGSKAASSSGRGLNQQLQPMLLDVKSRISRSLRCQMLADDAPGGCRLFR